MNIADGYAFSQEEHGIMSQVVAVEYMTFHHCMNHKHTLHDCGLALELS